MKQVCSRPGKDIQIIGKNASGEHHIENLGKEIYPVDPEKQRSVASDGHDLREKMN